LQENSKNLKPGEILAFFLYVQKTLIFCGFYGTLAVMIGKKKSMKEPVILISEAEFLESYNKNMPKAFPQVTAALLKKFKEEHSALFTHGELWSLDQHRKKIMDWLPRNVDTV